MLDRDLAQFYEVKPIRLREQGKRNADRFPSDFMFQLSDAEVDTMVSQSAIPSRQHLGGALPYAFTEQGVAALSGVLRSDRAVEVSIQIARAFVAMRRLLVTHSRVFQRLEAVENKQIETDKKLEIVLDALETGTEKTLQQGIFYNGQVFDAYTFVADLIRSAKQSLVLIDNYLDDSEKVMAQLRAFADLQPFKPLPPPLDDVAPERIRQISPDGVFTKRWELVDLVPDSEAAGGVAARIKPDPDKKLRVAHYERTDKRRGVITHTIDILPEDVPGEGYNLYLIGRSP